MAFGKVYQFTALCFGLAVAPQVFMRVMAPVLEFLHSLGFGFGLICMTGYSGVLPRVGSSFFEDGLPVVQFFRNSRQLREVSACVASEDVSSSESYWTLSVSGLLQPRNESTSFSHLAPCFYHEWINLRFLARVDEHAVLSDCSFRGWGCGCGRSGCSSSGLGPLRFRSSCAVVFGDPTGSFLVVGPRAARARQLAQAGVSPARLVVWLFRCRLGSRLNPFRGSEWTLNLLVFQQLRWRWPVSIDLFATTLFHRCLPYFSLFHDPNALRTEVLLQPWNGWQAYAFSPYALLPAIL